MSRSGYSDDCEDLNLYRGQVASSINGKRGQAFLKELADALDAMPVRRLITNELVDEKGGCCTMGAVCLSRSLDAGAIYYDDPWFVGKAMGIAECLAAEIAFMNDEWGSSAETAELRWDRMRKWVSEQIK